MSTPAIPGDARLTCSVVVPVRDDADQLAGLLRALEAQGEPPLEVIVVDNGSRDDGAALARAHGARVLAEPRRGIAAAAATGYDAARGDLVLRCDADSRPRPDWVAAHRRAHRSAPPGTVAVTGPGWFERPGGALGPSRRAPLLALASVLYGGSYTLATAAALGHVPLFGTTMSLRRDWWERIGRSASRSAEVHDDMDLSFRVAPGERVRWTRAVGVGMSLRALRPGAAARTRGRRAVRTLRRAWEEQPPWERWQQRIAARRAAAARIDAR